MKRNAEKVDAFMAGLAAPAQDDWLAQLPLDIDVPELGHVEQRHDPDMAWIEDYAPPGRSQFVCLHCGSLFGGPRARSLVQAHVIRLCADPDRATEVVPDDPPF